LLAEWLRNANVVFGALQSTYTLVQSRKPPKARCCV